MIALSCAALLAGPGCTRRPAPIELPTAGVEPAARYDDLAVVLKSGVREGKVIEEALRSRVDRLDAQLARLAVTGPTVTPHLLPAREHRLAYWYNVRAAWSLKLTLLDDCPDKITRRCLELRTFPVDGRRLSLADVDAILAADSDWRTAVAAPSIRQNEAGLPDEPFQAETVRSAIDSRFHAYLGDSDRFQIDVERKVMIFPPALWAVRERLVKMYERSLGSSGATYVTALLPHARGAGRRRLQDAIGYRVLPQRETSLVAFLEE